MATICVTAHKKQRHSFFPSCRSLQNHQNYKNRATIYTRKNTVPNLVPKLSDYRYEPEKRRLRGGRKRRIERPWYEGAWGRQPRLEEPEFSLLRCDAPRFCTRNYYPLPPVYRTDFNQIFNLFH